MRPKAEVTTTRKKNEKGTRMAETKAGQMPALPAAPVAPFDRLTPEPARGARRPALARCSKGKAYSSPRQKVPPFSLSGRIFQEPRRSIIFCAVLFLPLVAAVYAW